MNKLGLSDFEKAELSTRIVRACEDTIQVVPAPQVLLYTFYYQPGEVKDFHAHPEIRLTFVRSGRMCLTIQDQPAQELGTGDFATILPNVPHRLEVLGDAPLYLVEMVLAIEQHPPQRITV